MLETLPADAPGNQIRESHAVLKLRRDEIYIYKYIQVRCLCVQYNSEEHCDININIDLDLTIYCKMSSSPRFYILVAILY